MRIPCQTRLGAAIVVMASAVFEAGAVNFEVGFSATGQPIWDSSTEPSFTEFFLGVDEDRVFGIGPSIPGLARATFGVTSDLEIGIQTTVDNAHDGSIDVSLPFDVSIDFPDEVRAGDTITINTGYTIKPSASFTTTNTNGSASINLDARGSFGNLALEACITVICEKVDIATLPNGTFDLPDLPLYSVDSDSATIHPGAQPLAALGGAGLAEAGLLPDGWEASVSEGLTIPASNGVDINPGPSNTNTTDRLIDGFIADIANLQGNLSAPDLSQTGSFDGTAISGVVTDAFTDIVLDVDGFLPIPLGIGFAGFSIDLLDATMGVTLFARQDISVTPGVPEVTLDLGPLGSTTIALGDSIELTIPDGIDAFDITPTFTLESTLENELLLASAEGTLYRILGVSFGDLFTGEALIFNLGDELFFPPAGDERVNVNTSTCDDDPEFCNDLDLVKLAGGVETFSDTVPLAFGPVSTGPLSVTVLTRVPEPDVLWLLLAGLAPLARRAARTRRPALG